MIKNNREVAIKIDEVSKDFNLPHELNNNLKQRLLHPLKRTSTEKQHALKDVSFEIKKGDFFGIVGRNGSGKSTLLKIIAEIYAPTKGNVTVNGSLTPFIELGVGFNPELTGKENVFLNGAMLGFSKKEMASMYDEIVDFAELEKFMDQKLKNYSSGMQVRLAFSVAIRAKSDILLLDEVLAVGDINFQKKCFDYFRELKREEKTVVFVTHSMYQVKEYCTQALLIDDGKVVLTKDVDDTLDKYLQIMNPKQAKDDKRDTSKGRLNSDIDVSNISHRTEGSRLIISYSISGIDNNKKRFSTAFSISDIAGTKLFGGSSINFEHKLRGAGAGRYTWVMQNVLSAGKYKVNVSVNSDDQKITKTFEDVHRIGIEKARKSHFPIDPIESLSIDT